MEMRKCQYCGEEYQGSHCLFHPTEHADYGIRHFGDKPDKFYRMGWHQGFPHVEIEVYHGKGVIVHYLMTGVSYSWDWQYKEEAWTYAKDKDFHVKEIQAAGNQYANMVA